MSPSTLTTDELLTAAKNGDLQTLRYAIELLGDEIVNVADDEGVNCLHTACINGQKGVVQLLLYEVPSADSRPGTDADCQPEQTDNISACPSTSFGNMLPSSTIHSASECDERDVPDASALPRMPVSYGSANYTASSRVSTRGSDSCPNESADSESRKCLKSNEFVPESEYILTANRKPSEWASQVTQKGHTALHWAALKGHTAVAKELLVSGFDVNAITNQGTTSAHLAAAKNHLDCLKLLLQFKADISIKNKSGLLISDISKYMNTNKQLHPLTTNSAATDANSPTA